MSEYIKPHLEFDGESYRPIEQKELQAIMATHGTSIEAAAHLIVHRTFSREHQTTSEEGAWDLGDQFFTTPNPRFDFDIDALDGDFDPAEFADIDAIRAGIEYGDGSIGGAVIALSGKLPYEETGSIHTDIGLQVEGSNGIELVFEEAPTLEVVAGIYPIDRQSEKELIYHIKELRNTLA